MLNELYGVDGFRYPLPGGGKRRGSWQDAVAANRPRPPRVLVLEKRRKRKRKR